jgi:hypothetical protein
LLQAFHKFVEATFPRVAAAAQVHILRETSLEFLGGEKNIRNVFNAEDNERFSIQLFGHRTLLNCHLGGFYRNCLPKGADDEAFKNLQTNYF